MAEDSGISGTATSTLTATKLRIAEAVNHPTTLEDFATELFDLLKGILPPCDGILALFDPRKDVVSFPFYSRMNNTLVTTPRTALMTPLADVLDSPLIQLLTGDEYEAGIVAGRYLPRENLPKAWLGVPLLKDEQLFAGLVFETHDEHLPARLTAEHATIMEDMAPFLSRQLSAKLTLSALQESERKFRNYVEASTDITFQLTRTGYIDFVSANIETLFGCIPKDLIGKHFKVTTPMDQVSRVIHALKRITNGDTVMNMEIVQKLGTGERIPMEVNASPVFRGNRVVAASGIMRDISERKQARKEIERLANFAMANPMPVVEVDITGTPSYINPAGIKLLDHMNLDMAQVDRILPPHYRHAIREALSSRKQLEAQEVQIEDMHLLWSGHYLENQNLVHFYAADITPLKNTEKELIQAKEQAVQSERVKSLFLANMSHEIRTPLNSILGFTDLIEQELRHKIAEEKQEYFDIIHGSGKRLWRTVHEILDISQIETNTFDLKIESVNLSAILRELIQTLQVEAARKSLPLETALPEADIRIKADEYCVTQALTNLIDNAIKYTSQGYVRVGMTLSDDTATVEIADTGIGMSDEYQKRLFDPFQQESTGYTKQYQGVGLGLALSKRYLDLVDANLSLESQKDVGTTFRIGFHLNGQTQPQTSYPAGTNESTTAEPARKMILVVEDDANSQKLAEFSLRKEFDLCFAASVLEAKEQLNTHSVSLILLDLSLAGQEDGLDLARLLKASETWAEIPIIALTAHAFTTDRDRCLEAGCCDFVTKPFRRLDLVEKINRLTGT